MTDITHTLSIDVEEYFHAANLGHVAPARTWRRLPSRVEYSTQKVLDLFDRCNVKGTFFVLGCVAARCPKLVQEIARRGHEVGSHGYAHQLAFDQTPRQFARDVSRSKRLLEDLAGAPVLGYRAPNFSIREKNSWAYDALIAAGYRYDSSVYPVWHPRYENLKAPTQPFVIRREGGSLLEFPLATVPLAILGKEYRLPTAGGAYWRLLPGLYTRWGLQRLLNRGDSIHCYAHPWEFDSGQPVFLRLPVRTRFRHYGRISTFESRVAALLQLFRVAPFREVVPRLFSDASASADCQSGCSKTVRTADSCAPVVPSSPENPRGGASDSNLETGGQ